MNISPFYELKNRLYSSAASGCGTITEGTRSSVMHYIKNEIDSIMKG